MTPGEDAAVPSSEESVKYEQVRVLVETSERTFRGTVYKPMAERYRLSDYLNNYDRQFLCLTDVQVTDRGKEYRVGDRRDFIAVAVSAIKFISPVDENE